MLLKPLKPNKQLKVVKKVQKSPTKWQILLKTLKRHGWTQTNIGLECGVTQAAINQIKLGNTKEPKHELGENLLALANETTKQPKPKL